MQIRDPQFVYVSNVKAYVSNVKAYVFNVKARAIRSAVGIATDLADNIAHGVRWHDATSVAQELGCQLFLEMPPDHALSDLVRENLSEVEAYPVVSGSIDRLLKRCSKLKSYCHLRAGLARLTLEKCLERSAYQNTPRATNQRGERL
jgi:acyl transferase domain-containing protein